jgi:hypothetical protein
MYAFGWAQMQSHGDLILRLYGQSRGRGAEYWGSEYLDVDRWVRTMGVPARAAAWEKQQTPDAARALKAFADGIKAYARSMPIGLDSSVRVVLPVTVSDLLAHVPARRALHVRRQSSSRSSRRCAMGGRGLEHVGGLCEAIGIRPRAAARESPSARGRISFTWYEVQFSTPVSSRTARRSWACRFRASRSTIAWGGAHEQHDRRRRPLRTAAR